MWCRSLFSSRAAVPRPSSWPSSWPYSVAASASCSLSSSLALRTNTTATSSSLSSVRSMIPSSSVSSSVSSSSIEASRRACSRSQRTASASSAAALAARSASLYASSSACTSADGIANSRSRSEGKSTRTARLTSSTRGRVTAARASSAGSSARRTRPRPCPLSDLGSEASSRWRQHQSMASDTVGGEGRSCRQRSMSGTAMPSRRSVSYSWRSLPRCLALPMAPPLPPPPADGASAWTVATRSFSCSLESLRLILAGGASAQCAKASYVRPLHVQLFALTFRVLSRPFASRAASPSPL
mmetsp:Transcript_22366/g.56736  ORF Transcript_22366/g.56736 Transcript_22366/m.56736 type:complete len:299 (-) Transcript_22366:157-1053(-)